MQCSRILDLYCDSGQKSDNTFTRVNIIISGMKLTENILIYEIFEE